MKKSTKKNSTAIQKIHSYQISGTDQKELKHLVKEVFTQHTYYFETDRLDPIIIDVGAHVGVATHYFAHVYPSAHIFAVEPHPLSYELLIQNCEWNRLLNVTSIQAALVPQKVQSILGDENIGLYADSSDTWLSSTSVLEGAWNHQQSDMKLVPAPTITLHQLLQNVATKHPNRTVDLLKLDIEGAEWDVLLSAKEELYAIKRILLEYHPDEEHDLSKLIQHLQQYSLKCTNVEKEIKETRQNKFQLRMLEFVSSSSMSIE